MKIKITWAVLAITVWVGPLHADDLASGTTAQAAPTTNTTTIAASTLLSVGRYNATIAPNFNGEMAGHLEKAVGTIPGVESVTSTVGDSTIHFTVNKTAVVSIADVQRTVAKTFPGAVMTTPILEHSMTANPGL